MFKKLALLLLSLIVVSRAHADADLSHSQQAIHAFNQGVESFNAKDCNAAVDHFNDAISADSEFAEAYYARGACKYSQQNSDGAVMDLNDSLRLKPELVDARALRGMVYYQGDHFDQAADDFNLVLQQNPHEAQSLLGRGVIRLKRDDVSGAEKDFRTFVKYYPTHPYAARLRKILASLKGGAEENPSPASAAAPASNSTSAVRRSNSRTQALADSLLRHHDDLSDQYTRQVLRGERGQAVGDISQHTGHAAADNSGGVDIVEPQH